MRELDPARLKHWLETRTPVTILDIREAPEFEAWHIPGARNLPVYDDLREGRAERLVDGVARLPRDVPVVAVCRMGVLSRTASGVLRELGFEAWSLSGGMKDWGGVWSRAEIRLAHQGMDIVQVRRDGKGCLSYLLVAGGRAVVLDPSVEPEAYLEEAHQRGARITHVVETHVHADHLSRARAVCAVTGAELLLPASDRVRFPHRPVADGETLELGPMRLHAVRTPGHTSESTCYRLDGGVLFTGDTLFVQGVGRPDLERGDAGAEEGARWLHRSLHERILPLPSDTVVLPAHHGRPPGFDGTPVAASLAEVRSVTALLNADEPTFVRQVLASLPPKPPSHRRILSINEGRARLEGVHPLELEAGPNRCAAG